MKAVDHKFAWDYMLAKGTFYLIFDFVNSTFKSLGVNKLKLKLCRAESVPYLIYTL